jgi:hypothetical protein
MKNKHRHAVSLTQDNDCRCNGCSRSKQQSRYNKSAKRQSSRKARTLDMFVLDEQIIDGGINYISKSKKSIL